MGAGRTGNCGEIVDELASRHSHRDLRNRVVRDQRFEQRQGLAGAIVVDEIDGFLIGLEPVALRLCETDGSDRQQEGEREYNRRPTGGEVSWQVLCGPERAADNIKLVGVYALFNN